MLLSVSSIYALMHLKCFKALCTEVCNSGLPDYHKFTDNYRADVSYLFLWLGGQSVHH